MLEGCFFNALSTFNFLLISLIRSILLILGGNLGATSSFGLGGLSVKTSIK